MQSSAGRKGVKRTRVYLERCARERNFDCKRLPLRRAQKGENGGRGWNEGGAEERKRRLAREKRAFRVAPSSPLSVNGSGHRCAPEARRCARWREGLRRPRRGFSLARWPTTEEKKRTKRHEEEEKRGKDGLEGGRDARTPGDYRVDLVAADGRGRVERTKDKRIGRRRDDQHTEPRGEDTRIHPLRVYRGSGAAPTPTSRLGGGRTAGEGRHYICAGPSNRAQYRPDRRRVHMSLLLCPDL